VSNSRLSK